DNDQQLLCLLAPLRSSEVYYNPLSYMGKLFMKMGEYAYVKQFFLGMLQDASCSNQPHRLVRVNNDLGANYMIKGDYAKALEQYQQTFDVSLSYLPLSHTDLAPICDAIDKNYFHQGDYQKAVENYERAADLIEQSIQSGNNQIVNDLNIRIDIVKRLFNKKE
ncbi:unnamed protein product, partial [Rotaria sp. Silwood2]